MKYFNVPRVVLSLVFSYFLFDFYPYWKGYDKRLPIRYTYLYHQSFEGRKGTSYKMEYEYKEIKRSIFLSEDEYRELAVSNVLPTLYTDREGTVYFTEYWYKKKYVMMVFGCFILVIVILPIEFILVYTLNKIYPE